MMLKSFELLYKDKPKDFCEERRHWSKIINIVSEVKDIT